MPLRSFRPRSVTTANPPYAASMWNQMSSAAQKSASSGRGSMAPVAVAPAFAHTAMGFRPAARSSATMRASASRSMRERPSLGTMRA